MAFYNIERAATKAIRCGPPPHAPTLREALAFDSPPCLCLDAISEGPVPRLFRDVEPERALRFELRLRHTLKVQLS